MQHLLALDRTDAKGRETDKAHVPGLVGKCLRQATLRPPSAASPPILPHEQDKSIFDTPLLPHEYPKSPLPLVKSMTGQEEVISLSDSEDDSEYHVPILAPVTTTEASQNERELMIARKAMRKWWRLAGLNKRKGREMGFEKGEELGVAWTRGICPRVEGRIKIIGEAFLPSPL